MTDRTGRCHCGAVAYQYSGPENWSVHCHCESCRRTTSSAFTTYFCVPRDAFRWTGAAPAVYGSSAGVRRLFCAVCGAPMAYESDSYPHEIHLFAATLEDQSALRPQGHVFWAERVAWIEVGDELPKHDRFGSG